MAKEHLAIFPRS